MSHHNQIEDLFNTVTDRYDSMIRRICSTYAVGSVTADDLYQEAMLSIWRGLNGFRGDSAMSTWVYRISINSCISYLRRNGRYNNTVDLGSVFDIADNEPRVDNDEIAYLHLLISRLNEIDKAIILMWLDERSYNEIADVTGLNRSVIGARLTRIRSKLKRAFTLKLTEL